MGALDQRVQEIKVGMQTVTLVTADIRHCGEIHKHVTASYGKSMSCDVSNII